MKKTIFYVLIIVIAVSCKEQFSPAVVNGGNNTLVVDGFITGGTDSTYIKLSRVTKLSSSTNRPEVGATTTVEDDQGNTYGLREISAGTYAISPITLNDSRNYRVRIKTTDGLIYLSDFEPVKNSPAIDSVGYTINSNNLGIYINTHDAQNNTQYYRWDYAETWRFHAQYVSNYIFVNGSVVPRTAAQQIYFCFANDVSTNVLLGSSAKLSQDIISHAPIATLSAQSEKIGIRYSILIKQYAITKDAYDFWQNLQTSTENLGSIFDAQPSTSSGNVHCTTNSNQVIGFVGVGKTQQKRIFIDKKELPAEWTPTSPFYDCHLDSLGNAGLANNLQTNPNIIITNPYFTASGILAGYMVTARPCADCTVRGTVTQPSFWK